MKKKLPIGISDFKKIIDGNYYYFDKTELIKSIIGEPGEVKLFTRPRRFEFHSGIMMKVAGEMGLR